MMINDLEAKINNKFTEMLDLVGNVNGMIVVGPPGIGKTHGVSEKLGQLGQNVTVVKGTASAFVLYQRLWQTRGENFTLVIDDCDGLLTDLNAINLLKAALDTYDVRTVQWNTANTMLAANGIPQLFQYEGKVIFITNQCLRNPKPKWKPHWDALMSRALYIDLELDTIEAKLTRCRMVVENGMLTNVLSHSEICQLFSYMETYADCFREVSLRTIKRLVELRTKFPNNWEKKAVLSMDDAPMSAMSRFKGTTKLNFKTSKQPKIIKLKKVA
jgi:hypothetical protein